MVHPIVEHVASRSLTNELCRNLILPSRPLHLQVPLSVFFQVAWDPLWALCKSSVRGHIRQTSNSHTFLHLSHQFKVDAIIHEWESVSIDHLSLHSNAHMSLTKPWIDLLPVQVLLKDDGFDPLRQDAILQ